MERVITYKHQLKEHRRSHIKSDRVDLGKGVITRHKEELFHNDKGSAHQEDNNPMHLCI